MSSRLKIDIVSDHVCPWCYIGKRRLETALTQRPDVEAEITWLPFQLSPDMPPEGRDRLEHYHGIFGEARAREIMAGMRETAAGEGLQFQLKPGARSPNTLAAHRLMHWADQDPEVDQNALAEKLFAAHHCDCEDIGDPQVLAAIGSSLGMDCDAILTRLVTDADVGEVAALIERARQIGVTGVPFFIFNDQYAVSGAQPAEAIAELIDRLLAASE